MPSTWKKPAGSYSKEYLVTIQVESYVTINAYSEEEAKAKVLKNANSMYGSRRSVTVKNIEQVDQTKKSKGA